jgi:succinate dehydrogenase / fumarate reductase flavoprotein subunit
MQGMADGHFVISASIGDYLAGMGNTGIDANSQTFPACQKEAETRIIHLLGCKGKRTIDEFHG